jgi:hypothetical protein
MEGCASVAGLEFARKHHSAGHEGWGSQQTSGACLGEWEVRLGGGEGGTCMLVGGLLACSKWEVLHPGVFVLVGWSADASSMEQICGGLEVVSRCILYGMARSAQEQWLAAALHFTFQFTTAPRIVVGAGCSTSAAQDMTCGTQRHMLLL